MGQPTVFICTVDYNSACGCINCNRGEFMERKLVMLFLCIFLGSTPVWGAESTNFPESWPPQVREAAREMVMAGVPQDDTSRITQAMVQARIQQREIVKIQLMIKAAQETDQDPEPLINKAYEGLAKRVQGQNIVQAMERVRNRYEHAERISTALEPQVRERVRLRETIATGLAAGLQQEDAIRIAEQLRTREKNRDPETQQQMNLECYLTARDLVRHGVASQTAADLVTTSISHNYSSSDMVTMRNLFHEQSKNQEANALAKSYTNGVQDGCPAGELSHLGGSQSKGSAGSGSGSSSGGSAGSGGSGGSSGGSGGGSGGNGGSGGGNGGSGGNGGGGGGGRG